MPKAKTKKSQPPELEATNEEFERFREFAYEIINMPKSEIDRRAAGYEEQPKQTGLNPFRNKMIPP